MESTDGYYVTHAKGADSENKVRSFKRWQLARTRTHAWREPQAG